MPIPHKDGFYGIEYSKIVVAEQERLDEWFKQLQDNQPSEDAAEDPNILRSQLMLRLYYAQVQMVLYRPFLHHALRQTRHGSRTSLKAYACGSACVKAAMQVVWLAERLEASLLFNAALWHDTFIIISTAACLCLFTTSNRGTPAVDGTEDGVRRIKALIARHSNGNESLRRCLQFLQSIPSDGPPAGEHRDAELWNTFMQNTSPFADAFQATEHTDPEHVHGADMLQALSLPQLNPFLNARL
ncbi:hypothetical protein LTR62_002495 [Meristemomyces frigidus]|uniref:Uncharacterized protein n=1 Tax=Meristemomyces frigidus TaxID=1508187 RepID=A0AAN7YKP3_9PEZI|nr:hypothetical protein LTR62_002495 [Meristemomyces frigidus]